MTTGLTSGMADAIDGSGDMRQPLASIMSHAGAALRWLNQPRPDIVEACRALQNIALEGTRASAVAQLYGAPSSDPAAAQRRAIYAVRYARLTPRERETFALAIGGLLNKQIAAAMDVSDITAKVHKRRVMEKLEARSVADLVSIAHCLNIQRARNR